MSDGFRVYSSLGALFFAIFVTSCSGGLRSAVSEYSVSPTSDMASQGQRALCEKAIKRALGSTAKVQLCGPISRSDVLEVLGIVSLDGFKEDDLGIPVSKFAILREEKPNWAVELIADQQPVRNSFGYIGADNIDDSYGYSRYRISYSKQNKDEGSYSILVRFIGRNGETDGWPLEIDWNPTVKRFQEYSEAGTPLGFVKENKNPKHFRSKKS
jgi:hypothetical protein